MTIEEALERLRFRTDPLQTECLRCCAGMRLVTISVAGANMTAETPIDVDDRKVDAEVSRLFDAHPELRARFRPDGCPADCECRQESAA